MDWKRTLALYQWYGTDASCNVSQVLDAYNQAVTNSAATYPLPPYLEVQIG